MKRVIRQRLRRRAVVNLHDGTAFSGVLFEVDAEAIVLRNAEQLGAGEKGTNVVADGEILILRDEVAYIQLP